MSFIDPHVHMVCRVTDDYERMATAGCLAVSEPAFWPGFNRCTPQGFFDYFSQLTDVEPKRAAQFGIKHYTWLCINPKEAEDITFSRDVIALIPKFIRRKNVLGIGEIGLNKITRNEVAIFQEQIDLAVKYQQIIMVHTPHLEDKLKGTRIIIHILKEFKVPPEQVLIDHIEEHTAEIVLNNGFWAGITLYPYSKCSIPRAVDIVERYGADRLLMNSGGDWGPSDPLAVPRLQLEMRLRGHTAESINQVTLKNSAKFFSQSLNYQDTADERWVA